MTVLACLVVVALGTARIPAAPLQTAAPAQTTAVPATAANAAAFVGDWSIVTVAGQNGATTGVLSIKVDGEKVSAQLDSPEQGHHAINEMQKVGTSLVLAYTLDY